MPTPKERFTIWYRSARSVFAYWCTEYGRPLALKLLYDAYVTEYQQYMRWRDAGDAKHLVDFAYAVAMARLALVWREGAAQ